MIKLTGLVLFIALVFTACNNQTPKEFVVQPRDTTITVENSYNDLFLDSTAMEDYIAKQQVGDTLAQRIRSFYNSRNYQYAWFDSTGVAEYAGSFLNAQSQYILYSKDSSLYNKDLQQLHDSLTSDSSKYQIPGKKRLGTELALTTQFFRYAFKAYVGDSSINLQDLGWFIPRKKTDMTGLLDSLISNKGKNLENYEPLNKQYNLLKEQLLKYYGYQKEGEWDSIFITKKFYKIGDTSAALAKIKHRLFLTGDAAEDDTTLVFDTTLLTAVKHFQRRYGLKEDGAIGNDLLKEINRPIHHRIEQLLINMERMRWLPGNTDQDYLLVNIPAYRLYVYEKGQLAWSMNVVVGSEAHSTVIFNGAMKYIVFSPYWNIPNSIVRNEINPAIQRNPNYLARNNMERFNGGIRQKPGPKNSLGLVKFLFPNSYNIYLHDTPSKGLFNEASRAFSHGCIRLAEPKRLAEYLLRKDSAWTPEKINDAMNAGKEKYVTLNPTVPVVIGYFTAWVDNEGQLNFRDDIYGHDKKLAEKMFTKK